MSKSAESHTVGPQLGINRIASKFNPDTLYNIKQLKSNSKGSLSILKTEEIPIHGKMSSI